MIMKIQACTFNRVKGGRQERGLAFQQDFSSNDVKFIVDEDGKRIGSLWGYKLIEPTFENTNVGIDLDAVSLFQKGEAVIFSLTTTD